MNIFFDAVIFFYLISVGAFLIHLTTSWKEVPHKKTRAVVGVLLFFSWCVIFYGSFVEPRMLQVDEHDIYLSENYTQSLDVLVIGDIHAGPYRKRMWVEEVVQQANEQEPDLIVLVGDYIYHSSEQVEYLDHLAELKAPLGVYAVTGNHDYIDGKPEVLIDALESFGIQMLENATITIEVDGEELILAGISDIWFAGDINKTLEGREEEESIILLSHNPDAVLFGVTALADLVISGHTHGGQIRLPWVGSVSEIPDLLGREYDRGLFDYKEQQLFITTGVGETGPRARLFNPPQINLLHIFY